MARRAFPSRAVAVRGPRRLTNWFEILSTQTTLTAIGGTLIASLTADEKLERPFTIVRTHLEVQFGSDQIAASETQFGAVGMAVVSDQAAAAGVSAVPTPDTDAASDLWFLHQYLQNTVDFGDATGFIMQGDRRYQIDSKAMRKVNDSEDVILVAELNNIGGGQIVGVSGRFLIKVH